MGCYLDKPTLEPSSEQGSNGQISFGSSTIQGWRCSQEDAHINKLDLGDGISIFGVFDGHGGSEVAKYCAANLPSRLLLQPSYLATKNIAQALYDVYFDLDGQILTSNVRQLLLHLSEHCDRKQEQSKRLCGTKNEWIKRQRQIQAVNARNQYLNEHSRLHSDQNNNLSATTDVTYSMLSSIIDVSLGLDYAISTSKERYRSQNSTSCRSCDCTSTADLGDGCPNQSAQLRQVKAPRASMNQIPTDECDDLAPENLSRDEAMLALLAQAFARASNATIDRYGGADHSDDESDGSEDFEGSTDDSSSSENELANGDEEHWANCNSVDHSRNDTTTSDIGIAEGSSDSGDDDENIFTVLLAESKGCLDAVMGRRFEVVDENAGSNHTDVDYAANRSDMDKFIRCAPSEGIQPKSMTDDTAGNSEIKKALVSCAIEPDLHINTEPAKKRSSSQIESPDSSLRKARRDNANSSTVVNQLYTSENSAVVPQSSIRSTSVPIPKIQDNECRKTARNSSSSSVLEHWALNTNDNNVATDFPYSTAEDDSEKTQSVEKITAPPGFEADVITKADPDVSASSNLNNNMDDSDESNEDDVNENCSVNCITGDDEHANCFPSENAQLQYDTRIGTTQNLPKKIPGMTSGCTAVVCVITEDNRMFVANAGDSRAVLCRKKMAIPLSFDHNPEVPEERKRIINAGHKVTQYGRIDRGLNLSRSIGDHVYKNNITLPPEQQAISCQPDITILDISPDDDFVILACDGIWNCKSNQQVCDMILSKLHKKSLAKICEEVCTDCLAHNTDGDGTGCDNMTMMIITFEPHTCSNFHQKGTSALLNTSGSDDTLVEDSNDEHEFSQSNNCEDSVTWTVSASPDESPDSCSRYSQKSTETSNHESTRACKSPTFSESSSDMWSTLSSYIPLPVTPCTITPPSFREPSPHLISENITKSSVSRMKYQQIYGQKCHLTCTDCCQANPDQGYGAKFERSSCADMIEHEPRSERRGGIANYT